VSLSRLVGLSFWPITVIVASLVCPVVIIFVKQVVVTDPVEVGALRVNNLA
jgi:hypothetical protein